MTELKEFLKAEIMPELKELLKESEKPNQGGPDDAQQRINQMLIKRLDDIDKRNDEMSTKAATEQKGFLEIQKNMEAKADKRAEKHDDLNLKLSASIGSYKQEDGKHGTVEHSGSVRGPNQKETHGKGRYRKNFQWQKDRHTPNGPRAKSIAKKTYQQV